MVLGGGYSSLGGRLSAMSQALPPKQLNMRLVH